MDLSISNIDDLFKNLPTKKPYVSRSKPRDVNYSFVNLEDSIKHSFIKIQNRINKSKKRRNWNNSSLNSSPNKSIMDSNKMNNFSKILMTDKIVEYEEFKEKINGKMSDYDLKFNHSSDHENITYDEKVEIKKRFLKDKKYRTEYDSSVSVSVGVQNFSNPYDSLNVLKNNNSIFDEILGNYEMRHKQLLQKTIQEIDKSIKLRENKHIKVSNIIKKPARDIVVTSSIKVPEIVPLIKPTGNNTYSELFGRYIYTNKNFPESREQFTFTYGLLDIILFGGIVVNKSNHMWSLDPSNL